MRSTKLPPVRGALYPSITIRMSTWSYSFPSTSYWEPSAFLNVIATSARPIDDGHYNRCDLRLLDGWIILKAWLCVHGTWHVVKFTTPCITVHCAVQAFSVRATRHHTRLDCSAHCYITSHHTTSRCMELHCNTTHCRQDMKANTLIHTYAHAHNLYHYHLGTHTHTHKYTLTHTYAHTYMFTHTRTQKHTQSQTDTHAHVYAVTL